MRCYTYLKENNADSLTLQEREVPRPGPGQVLVRMKAASLNYRDTIIVWGRYPNAEIRRTGPWITTAPAWWPKSDRASRASPVATASPAASSRPGSAAR